MGASSHLKHKRTPAHHAHPTPPAHIQPPPAPVKQHEDVQSYVTSLTLAIDQCKTDWEHYGHAVSAAYAWAWHAQGAVLREVRESIEKRKKAEEADAMFALNLLTCGLGGGLAATCAKKVLGWDGEELKEQFVDKMVDMAKEKGKEAGKKASEWMYKHLGHPDVGDAFQPVGTEPDQFGEEIMEGIEYRVGTLWDLARNLQQQAVNGVTLEGVRKVYESVVTMPFVTERPDRRISSGVLRPKALMALWLSWAWNRDVEYWRTHSRSVFNAEENIDFEPVRGSLLSIGVPESRISQPFFGGTLGAIKQTEKLRKQQSDAAWDELKLIDMTGYIEWANSTDAIELLFHGLPKKLEWFNQIPVQLQIRKALGPYARYLKS